MDSDERNSVAEWARKSCRQSIKDLRKEFHLPPLQNVLRPCYQCGADFETQLVGNRQMKRFCWKCRNGLEKLTDNV